MTPYQQQLHEQHKARQQRMAQAAAAKQQKDFAVAQVVAAVESEVLEPLDIPIFLPPRKKEQRADNKPMVLKIIVAVAHRFEMSVSDVLSHRRTQKHVKPRQIAMYLARVMTLQTLPQIGRSFNGRDHTTVLHAIRKIEGLLPHDDDLRETIDEIERELTPAPPNYDEAGE